MYIIIVGAEVEGQRLVEIAVKNNHEVTLIETDESKARKVLKQNDVRVLGADIADDAVMEEAEIERADAVFATTYDDSKNLMAMLLAKNHDVKQRISLVNQQSHHTMFENLGVLAISDPAGIIANQLYSQLS